MTKEREVTFSHFPTNDKVLVKTNGMEAFGGSIPPPSNIFRLVKTYQKFI
jgi:hypothetical protein